MRREIVLNNINPQIRTVCFDKPSDPYILAHRDAQELSDGTLASYYLQWRGRVNSGNFPETAEEFEEFLSWLEEERGFIYLAVVDEMYQFAG